MIANKIRNSIILVFIQLLFVTIYFFTNRQGVNDNVLKFIGIISGGILTYIIISWYKCTRSLINGYLIFVVAFYAFNLGQTLLNAFGVEMGYKDLLYGGSLTLSKGRYFEAAFVGCMYILFMHIGAMVSLLKSNSINRKNKGEGVWAANIKYVAIRKTAIVFMVISLPFWIYYFYKTFSMSLMYGYDGFDEALHSTSSYIRIMKIFFEPSLLMLMLCSFYFNKNKWLPVVLLIVFVFLPPLIMGGRTQSVIIAALMLLIYALFYKIQPRKFFLLLIGGYFFLIVLHVVGKTRHEVGMSIKDYSEFLSSAEINPAISTLTEMGWSMYPLGETMTIVENGEPYRYGSTYFWALTSVIPNLGFWNVHPSETHSNLGKWLYNKLNLDFGPGYSIAAEAYINFGYFGFVFFLIYGYILAKYCQFINRRYLLEKPIQIILTVIFLWFAIKTVRNSFQDTVRTLFYVCLPIYLVYRSFMNSHHSKLWK